MKDQIQKVLAMIAEQDKEIEASRQLDIWGVAREILGYPGAMLSGSKTAPKGQTIVWNSNVCTKEHGKIWFGDLNITRDRDKLKLLSETLGTRIYVLYEMDARFDNELNPRFDEAVYSVGSDGAEEYAN